jgi:hypothetical protein
MNWFSGVLLLACSAIASGDVYRWVDPNGSVSYGDHPANGAQLLQLPMWVPPPPSPSIPLVPPAIKPIAPEFNYDWIIVQKPRHGEYVRDEGRGIAVAIAVRPPFQLDQGHAVRILLDGVPQGSDNPELTRWLTGVERGRHTLAAQVVDSEGRTLIESQPVSFFYQRPSHAFTAPRLVPSPGPVGIAPQAPRFQRFPRAPNVPPAPAVPGTWRPATP